MKDLSGFHVVTIDGPAGAGKSTVAKMLARRLNYAYLDTGAMYRALTLKAMRTGCELAREESLIQCAQKTTIALKADPVKGLRVFLEGEDVSDEIRTLEVTNNTFYVARVPAVREILVGWQRDIGKKQNVVVEGRDVGTVVFPEASFKFYLDAEFSERVRRRLTELRDKGKAVEAEQLRCELSDRDQKDLTRTVGPLKKAEDAIMLDSTSLSIEDVVDSMLNIIQAKRAVPEGQKSP